ncbi:MAG: thioredoxin [Alphaproteobacteria bacterium]|nr:thioredoxin [Alphaproteobacteria bacterium]
MEALIGQSGGVAAPANVIKDTTTQSFGADVLQASLEAPVIVDFWAPWCGPCKQLTPILEKVVKAAGGKVRMVKLNIDDNPEIAQELRIQSIPAVFAFSKGQPVDGFVGALPESQVKSFIERLIGPVGPSPVEQELEQAKIALDAGDFQAAGNLYSQILGHAPGEPQAIGGLARCFVALGKTKEAKDLLTTVDPKDANNPAVKSATAALALAEQTSAASGAAAGAAELEAKLAANPADHQARFDLAMVYYAAGRNDEAVDALIAIIRHERKWNDEAARLQLLKLFEALGPTNPATTAGRRKLSSVLFS